MRLKSSEGETSKLGSFLNWISKKTKKKKNMFKSKTLQYIEIGMTMKTKDVIHNVVATQCHF